MVIADTGFWLALANRKDRHHARAVAILSSGKMSLITTWPVMTETCHLLLNAIGTDAQLAFLRSYHDRAFDLFSLTETHGERLLQLMHQYRDLPMDLADASLVILAEHLDKGLILSTDRRDFKTYKWKNRKPFTNLLLPES